MSTTRGSRYLHNGVRKQASYSSAPSRGQIGHVLANRPTILAITKLLFASIAQIPAVQAIPLSWASIQEEPEGKDPEDPALWIYLAVAAALVLLGGAFAGLTIALMGQDEIYLQVTEKSGEGAERKQARKVLNLLEKGKHWVLVTLLLSNVITNETLPIVLDRSLGGGWPAVLGSTVLIVIFGEIAPQSVCVRYGLPIGAFMAPFVLALMYIMSPIAWPTAKLLDKLLGEDHGTVYKKAGLKTLVTLHRTLGAASERLNEDEVTIISAVLDLKDKPVGSVMTPMDDVFTMSLDDILNEETMDTILRAGYSRIPIHTPDNDQNFVGMLLVKMLITYDPEDAKKVSEFALATLPETRPETSCLDIVNFFQEGKSHMVLVSEFPSADHGALGVVTLEDVIEELIGEEIIDESDMFIDVHKAIRRLAPAPMSKFPKGHIINPSSAKFEGGADDVETKANYLSDDGKKDAAKLSETRKVPAVLDGGDRGNISRKGSWKLSEAGTPPNKTATIVMRRSSQNGSAHEPEIVRTSMPQIREHLKHLGPSNLASRPKQTRYTSVKIKPGTASRAPTESSISKPSPIGETTRHDEDTEPLITIDVPISTIENSPALIEAGIGAGLVTGGRDASDGVQAVQTGRGSMDRGTLTSPVEHIQKDKAVQAPGTPNSRSGKSSPGGPTRHSSHSDYHRRSGSWSPGGMNRSVVRSGSITTNIIDVNGVKKLIVETTSSSDEEGSKLRDSVIADIDEHDEHGHKSDHSRNDHDHDESNWHAGSASLNSRKKRKKRKNKAAAKHASGHRDEATPLLGGRS
ncbi:MAG: hypothetical protein M1834_002578 [Cirrosporium novae-zelandiae]|nr:MAG: hypothetical protein M1834_002578 [Cirrosporium novae-zelandiae]